MSDISETLQQLLAAGDAEQHGVDDQGQPLYRLTPQGMKRTEDLLRSRGIDPDELKATLKRIEKERSNG